MEPLVKTLKILLRYLHVAQPSIEIINDEDINLVVLVVRDHHGNSVFKNSPELLNPFSIITREILDKVRIQTTVIIDYDGDKLKILKETKNKAHIAYQRVIHYGKPYTFPLLNPFERFLIHQYLSHYQDVQTESFGEKNERTLVISKKTNTYPMI